jgi:hypothetical protein
MSFTMSGHAICGSASARPHLLVARDGGTGLRRASVWDLKLGEPIAAQPAPAEFRGFACGANGGAPRQPVSGWSDFKRCAPEADGLREVYFEYDDEYEYIARAKDLPREVARWAGTAEAGFPVIVSALFDEQGGSGAFGS